MSKDKGMIEEEVEIRATDGTPEGVLFRPEGEGSLPGVIYLTDIGGIRQATRDMARRLAEEGYCVLMPNVFYRVGRPPLWDFPRRLGEERTMKRIAELSAPMTPEAMERDASDYQDSRLTDCFVKDLWVRWYWKDEFLKLMTDAGFSNIQPLTDSSLYKAGHVYVFRAQK